MYFIEETATKLKINCENDNVKWKKANETK